MAGAPHKQGLDYISIDINIFDDPRVLLLEDQIPDRGFKFYLYFVFFAGRRSHYIKWDNMTKIEFCKAFNVEKQETESILSSLLGLGLFDNNLFKKHAVISSESMQSNYLLATSRRQFSIFIEEYLLIDLDAFKGNKRVRLTDRYGAIVKDYSLA